MNTVKVTLKAGREKPVLHGHPWIFSGAIDKVEGNAEPGDGAEVVDSMGHWLARGLIHPGAALTVRLYTTDENQPMDAELFRHRIDAAVALREALLPTDDATSTNAYRLVYSEADGLSGLIVDRYADVLAVQLGTPVLLPFLDDLVSHLTRRTGLSRVVLRADPDSVDREKLDPAKLGASEDVSHVRFREGRFQFDVDLREGQKTGFFLDQRVNRARVAGYAAGRRILSAYCYTGAFEVYAAAAGAREIVGLDRSEPAIVRAKEHHQLNGSPVPVEYICGDTPETLRRFRDAGRTFDMIILDPPRFVASRAKTDRGMRGYKDINLFALKLLSPGGILATFSCSGLVPAAQFKTMVGWASVDARRNVRIIEQLGQPPDHPILASFPESDYLKGLVCVAE